MIKLFIPDKEWGMKLTKKALEESKYLHSYATTPTLRNEKIKALIHACLSSSPLSPFFLILYLSIIN